MVLPDFVGRSRYPEKITDQIARGDANAAVKALSQHLSGTLSFVEEVRARHPQWTT
jgi:DNA-binding GntR family transcriptional regulator